MFTLLVYLVPYEVSILNVLSPGRILVLGFYLILIVQIFSNQHLKVNQILIVIIVTHNL